MNGGNGWMDVSKEQEDRDNPVEEYEWSEEEELQVQAHESEKAVDDCDGCSVSFPFMHANSDVVTVCVQIKIRQVMKSMQIHMTTTVI